MLVINILFVTLFLLLFKFIFHNCNAIMNKVSWLRTGPMIKSWENQKIYKNNEVITITSACVCARVVLWQDTHTHTHTCTHNGNTHRQSHGHTPFLCCVYVFVQLIIASPQSLPLSVSFIPLFIHYCCNYIVIPFYNIYPFIPIRKIILTIAK